jgi:long-chain fatty acid transport protein
MKQRGKTVRFLLTVAFIVLTGISLSANGLNLNGVGSKAIAMGGAFIGLADDYSAIFWNPAALTQTKQTTLFMFETNLIPKGTYQFSLAAIDTKSVSKIYPSGAIGYLRPINDKLVLGLCAYVPAGSGSTWDGNALKNLSGGKVFIWKSMIAIVTVAPVIAYKVSDTFSLGATINLNYGLLNLQRPTAIGQFEEKSSGIAFGATLGAFFKPSDKFSAGVNFRTPSKVKFKGTVKMAGAALMGLPAEDDSEREASWPMWLGAGIAAKPIDKLTITADVQYTNWKKVQDIPITFSNAGWKLAFETVSKLDLKWKDTIQYRLGLQYALCEKWALRAGYYYDPSPSPNETLSILLPEITYNVITAGFGYQAGKLTIDACFEMLMGKDATMAPGSGTGMPGTHGMNILVPNIALTYRF